MVNKLRRRAEPLKQVSKHRPIHHVHLQLAGNVLDRNPHVLAARRLVEELDAANYSEGAYDKGLV